MNGGIDVGQGLLVIQQENAMAAAMVSPIHLNDESSLKDYDNNLMGASNGSNTVKQHSDNLKHH